MTRIKRRRERCRLLLRRAWLEYVAGLRTLAPGEAAELEDLRAYDPDQPRDDHGRFGQGDGGTEKQQGPAKVEFPPDDKVRDSKAHPKDKDLPAHLKDSRNGLTRSERGSLKDYSNGSDGPINNALRSGTEAQLGPGHQETLKNLRSAFTGSEEFPKAEFSWRGLAFDDSDKFGTVTGKLDAAMAEKKPVMFRGYMSTSLNPSVAAKFASGTVSSTGESKPAKHQVLFEIAAKKGIYLNGTSQYKSERELLLDHNSRFRVVAKKDIKIDAGRGTIWTRTTYQLEQL